MKIYHFSSGVSLTMDSKFDSGYPGDFPVRVSALADRVGGWRRWSRAAGHTRTHTLMTNALRRLEADRADEASGASQTVVTITWPMTNLGKSRRLSAKRQTN